MSPAGILPMLAGGLLLVCAAQGTAQTAAGPVPDSVIIAARMAGVEEAKRAPVATSFMLGAVGGATATFLPWFGASETMATGIVGAGIAISVIAVTRAPPRFPADLEQQIRFWKEPEREAFRSAYQRTLQGRQSGAALLGVFLGAVGGYVLFSRGFIPYT